MTPVQIEFQIRRAFNAIYPNHDIRYEVFDETIVVTASVYGHTSAAFRYDIASDDDGYFYFGLVMHDHTVSDLAVVRIPYPESTEG